VEAGIHHAAATAKEDSEIGGKEIKKGDKVVCGTSGETAIPRRSTTPTLS